MFLEKCHILEIDYVKRIIIILIVIRKYVSEMTEFYAELGMNWCGNVKKKKERKLPPTEFSIDGRVT